MVVSTWMVRGRHVKPEGGLNKIYEGLDNYFTLKIYHGGMFTRSPGRRYIDGQIDYVDFVDIDLFSTLELDALIQELGYVNEDLTLFHHYLIPGVGLDLGLLPLGNDADVHRLAQYVTDNKEIKVYIETGFSRVNNHFISPTEVVIKQMEDVITPVVATNNNQKKDVLSSSRKLDFSKQIVPFGSKVIIDIDATDGANDATNIDEDAMSGEVGNVKDEFGDVKHEFGTYDHHVFVLPSVICLFHIFWFWLCKWVLVM